MTDNCFFAASNGGGGFRTRFCDVFDPKKFDTVYIIKGGPGTGKSTFMKKLGEEAERRGYDPSYCFCSSDTKSLDGVIIKELGVCVLDGTAPHVTEAKYPGACEIVLNFGEAFNVNSLRAHRGEIESLVSRNGERYVRAYSHLRAASEHTSEERRVAKGAYLASKAAAFIKRTFDGMKRGITEETGICTVCGGGILRLPVYFSAARRVYEVDCYHGIGYLLLSDIAHYARAVGIRALVSRDPVCPDYIESVYFKDDGVYVAVADGNGALHANAKRINAARFASDDVIRAERAYLRKTHKLALASVDCAVAEMKSACEIHDRIEEFYIAYTDFSVIDGIYEKVKKDIFEK